jgi:hypothetical protein
MAMLYDVAEARLNAPIHVQIELSGLPASLPTLGEIRMGGAVIRVFRGTSLVQVGSHVAFKIWVCRQGDEPTGPPFVYRDELVRMRYIEAYLWGQPPDCSLVGYECLLIATPSSDPQLPVDVEDSR